MDDREAYEFYADPEHLQIAGPARKHPKDQLTKILSARISLSLLAQITAAAASEGRTAGAWVRRAVRNELERSGWRAAERARRHRKQLEVVPGSGRVGEPRAIPSSLSLRPRTFSCPHLSIGNAESVSCGICGPLEAAA